jgi:hypothetical protein
MRMVVMMLRSMANVIDVPHHVFSGAGALEKFLIGVLGNYNFS